MDKRQATAVNAERCLQQCHGTGIADAWMRVCLVGMFEWVFFLLPLHVMKQYED